MFSLAVESVEGGKREKRGGGERKPCLFLPVNICPNDRPTNQSSEGQRRAEKPSESKREHERHGGNFHPVSGRLCAPLCSPWGIWISQELELRCLILIEASPAQVAPRAATVPTCDQKVTHLPAPSSLYYPESLWSCLRLMKD